LEQGGLLQLAQLLPSCPTLSTLILDNNDLHDTPVSKVSGSRSRFIFMMLVVKVKALNAKMH
jgi:hypothetical protein